MEREKKVTQSILETNTPGGVFFPAHALFLFQINVFDRNRLDTTAVSGPSVAFIQWAFHIFFASNKTQIKFIIMQLFIQTCVLAWYL